MGCQTNRSYCNDSHECDWRRWRPIATRPLLYVTGSKAATMAAGDIDFGQMVAMENLKQR